MFANQVKNVRTQLEMSQKCYVVYTTWFEFYVLLRLKGYTNPGQAAPPVETVSDDVCGRPCGSCHYGNRSSGNADALCGKDDLQDHRSVQRMEIQKYICG